MATSAHPGAPHAGGPPPRAASSDDGPSGGRAHRTGPLDDDPFARLTDADLERLRHDPLELAEELRFGSYWLAHATSDSERAHQRALEVAAAVIEELVARPQGEADGSSTGLAADPAQQAPRGCGLPATPPPATPAPPAPTPTGPEVVAVIEAQLAAYTEYARRLARYLDDLRALLPAGRGRG